MANELQTKLDTILEDKNTNLLPENLKAGVTCLGIEGTLEVGNSNCITLVPSVEDLNNLETPKSGEFALVYDIVDHIPVNGLSAKALHLPKVIEVPEDTENVYNVYYAGGNFNSNGMAGGFGLWQEIGMGAVQHTLYDRTTTVGDKAGGTYTRTDNYGDYWLMSGTLDTSSPEELETAFFQSIGFCNLTFTGVYFYNGTTWEVLPATNLTAIANDVLNGKVTYSKNGIITGTFNLNNYLFFPKTEFQGNATNYNSDLSRSGIIAFNKKDVVIGSKDYILSDNGLWIFNETPEVTIFEYDSIFCIGEGITYTYINSQGTITEGSIASGGLLVRGFMDDMMTGGITTISTNMSIIGTQNTNRDNRYEMLKPIANASHILNTAVQVSLDGTEITGTIQQLDTSDATATSSDIVSGKTAYVNGEKIEGTISERRNQPYLIPVTEATVKVETKTNEVIMTASVVNNGTSYVIDGSNTMNASSSYEAVAEAIGLTADKIKAGETILGITGTYTGETTE